jgi:hypothetical protein
MAGEVARDETPEAEEQLRVCMLVPMLDALCTQMTDRFGDDQARLLQEMSLFSSANVNGAMQFDLNTYIFRQRLAD